MYRRPLTVIGLLLLAVGLGACRSTTLINALTPRGDFDLKKNISYGEDPRQQLDIYTPTARPMKSAIVVFVHGGSWADGDKKHYLFVGQAFAEMGYLTVIPNYRLYPQVKFPDFIDDIALAIARLKDLLPQNTCPNERNIILVGHSAGAHSVAMLATDPQYLQRNNIDTDAGNNGEDPRSIIATWVGLAGPYNLPLDHPMVVDKFTTVTNNVDANPVNLATAAVPPALLLHGEEDETAYPKHTRELTARLQQLGVPVVTHFYPTTNHTKLVGGLAKNLRFLNPVYKDIESYLAAMGLDELCQQAE